MEKLLLSLSKKNQDLLKRNLEEIQDRIKTACLQSKRSEDSVTLLPVTKYHDAEHIKALYTLGMKSFGESRLLNLLEKKQTLQDLNLSWHLIGSLQTNKVNKLKDLDIIIHSVDRLKLLEKLSQLNQKLKIFLQVNVSLEETKQGFTSETVFQGLEAALKFKSFDIYGLMTMAPKKGHKMTPRSCFSKLRELKLKLEETFGIHMPHLSMGMSHDFEEAILEGSTYVRVGSALFKGLL